MEPSQTSHGAALPQQELTQPAGGCSFGPRPANLMQGGDEGANPHLSQRVASEGFNYDVANGSHATEATGNALQTKPDIKHPFTRLDAFRLLYDASRKANILVNQLCHSIIGSPRYLNETERLALISSALGFSLSSLTESELENLAISIGNFICLIVKRFKECHCMVPRFERTYGNWLSEPFIYDLPKFVIRIKTPCLDLKPSPTVEASVSTKNHLDQFRKRQRSFVLTDDPSNKSKNVSPSILSSKGPPNKKSTHSLEPIVDIDSPDKSTQKQVEFNKKVTTYTPEEALTFVIDAKINEDTYKFLKEDADKRGAPLYPSFSLLADARQSCYPSEDMYVSEIEVSVTFQGLLAHTFQRIVKLQDEVINRYMAQYNISKLSCVLEGAWGIDSSIEKSYYQYRFNDTFTNPIFDENSVIATTFVPLKIKACEGKKHTIWINPVPQSFRFCRPLHIQYRKQSMHLLLSEKKHVEDQIRNMFHLTVATSKGLTVTATCDLTLSFTEEVHSIKRSIPFESRCPICELTYFQFNDLDLAFSAPIVEKKALQNGLSPPRAYIKFLEFLLHLGYKNYPRHPKVKRAQISKSPPLEKNTPERKTYIQKQIKERLNLFVDVVRPDLGTTNDGYTAQRVFETEDSRQIFADILEIEKWLVDDIHAILVAINCGLPVDAKRFGIFCRNLAYKYVESYNWHTMSITLHKILIHAEIMIQQAMLPVGLLHEQTGDILNALWRYDNEHFSRNDSKTLMMKDFFQRTLESSDPVISNLHIPMRQRLRQYMQLPTAVKAILKPFERESEDTDQDIHYDEIISCIESEENEFTSVLVNGDCFVKNKCLNTN